MSRIQFSSSLVSAALAILSILGMALAGSAGTSWN
jgi:hypothetical protein